MIPGISPFCALVEVAAADTHANYLICRGYDTRDKKFRNYDADEDKPGIAVAKPYGKRATGLYSVGEVYAAFLPQSLIGQNAGTVNGDDLLDLELLKTDDGKYINWLLIDTCILNVNDEDTEVEPAIKITFSEDHFTVGDEGSGEARVELVLTGGLVAADDCWLGVSDIHLKHLQPYTDTDVANCETQHFFEDDGVIIRWAFDDAGHLIGYYTCGYVWVSPWGLTDPHSPSSSPSASASASPSASESASPSASVSSSPS